VMTVPSRFFLIIPGLVVLLSVPVARVYLSGREELTIARQCRDTGLDNAAIDHFARAARWYLPFSSTSYNAIEGLLDISRGFRAAGDDKTALMALREARGAILASRWFLTPHRDVLEQINRDIATLMVGESLPGGPGSDADENLAQLQATTLPNPWLSGLAGLLFLAWIPVTVIGAARSVTREGRFAGRQGIVWISASAGLLCGWLLILAIA